jgi:hypothetical protein
MLMHGWLIQVQERDMASLRDHTSLKMRGERRQREITQPPTLSDALNVFFR